MLSSQKNVCVITIPADDLEQFRQDLAIANSALDTVQKLIQTSLPALQNDLPRLRVAQTTIQQLISAVD